MIDLTTGTGKIQDEPRAFVVLKKSKEKQKPTMMRLCQKDTEDKRKRSPRTTLDNLNNKIG